MPSAHLNHGFARRGIAQTSRSLQRTSPLQASFVSQDSIRQHKAFIRTQRIALFFGGVAEQRARRGLAVVRERRGRLRFRTTQVAEDAERFRALSRSATRS